jgi:hypothetical protein
MTDERQKKLELARELILVWEDGYRAGLDLSSDDCPIEETDMEPFKTWRDGYLRGRQCQKS